MTKNEEKKIANAISKIGITYSELGNVNVKTTIKIVDLSGCSSSKVSEFINKKLMEGEK